MNISKDIERKFFLDIESGHHRARKVSMRFFIRLVEDLTYSEVIDYDYDQEKEVLTFKLTNYDSALRVDIYGDSLQACTRDIVMQTQAFISRNERY